MAEPLELAKQRAHNNRLPVLRLPDEILTDIFCRCAPHPEDLTTNWHSRQNNYEYFERRSSWKNYRGILNLAQVCHRWRRIAEEIGALWTHQVVFDDIDTTDVAGGLHRRAKGREMLIDVGLKDEKFVPAWVVKALARTKSLQIVAKTNAQLKSLLTYPAPILKSLTIASGDTDFMNNDVIQVPGEPFYGICPNLKSLTLLSVFIPWNNSMLQNLTVLRLFNMEGIACTPTVEKLVTALALSPGLEVLYLDKSGPEFLVEDDGTVVLPPRRTKLPRLHDLSILYASDCDHAYYLMSCLDLQPMPSIRISHDSLAPSEVKEILPRNISHTALGSNALAIRFLEEKKESFTLEFGVCSALAEPGLSSTNFEKLAFFDFSTTRDGYNDDSHIGELLIRTIERIAVAPTDIHKLVVQSDYMYKRSIPFQEILEFFPKLQSLEITCWKSEHDVAVVSRTFGIDVANALHELAYMADADNKTALPHLIYLSFEGGYFSEVTGSGYPRHREEWQNNRSFDYIWEFMEHRNTRGEAPKLAFTACRGMKDSFYEKLEKKYREGDRWDMSEPGYGYYVTHAGRRLAFGDTTTLSRRPRGLSVITQGLNV
ncbi:hypothetical protein SCHPADRAFT_928254 [Schizopora paradoxa]|uniref:F-box domain-containing protein n=1 Tax=Schizopora paradoxa TaxID=27342 RepID=A0A0H2SAB0_9AGAM|nr:hypothetical protein SCHPADRAFT_928254 [Schizopora paradoxa]